MPTLRGECLSVVRPVRSESVASGVRASASCLRPSPAQPAADRISAGLHPGLCDLHLGVGQIERSAKLRQHSTGVIHSHS